jgi:hypothetical protein
MPVSDVQFPMGRIVPIALISMAAFGSNRIEPSTDHEGDREYGDTENARGGLCHARHVVPPFTGNTAYASQKFSVLPTGIEPGELLFGSIEVLA